MVLSIDSIYSTYAVAFFTAFHKLVPMPLIMIHYTVVSTWIGDSGCDETPMGRFITYWTFMIIFSLVWGFSVHWPLRIANNDNTRKKVLFCTWQGLLSGFMFIVWSFIRAKPFKCFDEGEHLAYVFGPPMFWFAHIIALGSTGVLISRYGYNQLNRFVTIDDDNSVV